MAHKVRLNPERVILNPGLSPGQAWFRISSGQDRSPSNKSQTLELVQGDG
jgi:hypothetical protein